MTRAALVLCYHAIGETWPSAVAPGALRRQLEILLRRGYVPTTFTEAVHSGRAGRQLAVTFDDAYASVLERAFPILSELGVPATVFAVTRFADEGRPLEWPGLAESGVTPDPDARQSLSWTQLRELADAGWEVGSHTLSHPRLTELDDDELERELVESKSACSQALARPCRSIAYPYGDHDPRVVAATAAAGYETACTLSVSTSGPLAWPRVGIYGPDASARFRLKVSPAVLWARRAVASRAWPAR